MNKGVDEESDERKMIIKDNIKPHLSSDFLESIPDKLPDELINHDNILPSGSNDVKEIITDLNKSTLSELKNILINLGLPTSGNKLKLIQRIKENKSLQL